MADCPLGLAAGSSAKLAYGPGFTHEKLQLLEVDEELLQEIIRTGVVIKGAPADEAVLCTASKTFVLKQVETSNTLLLIPPAGDADAHMHSADGEAAEGGAGAQQSVVATCCATAHFEVVEIAPPLGVLEAMLAAACYGERNEAPAASGQGGGAHVAGYSWLELTQRVQCSDKELSAALRRLQAMEKDGRWMTLEPAYLRSLLDVIILTAGAHGWSLTSFPRDDMVDAVVADGYERDVVAHCLHIFGPAQAPADGTWSLDATAVCIARARGLLSTTPRWRLDDFMTAWRASCPEARVCRPASLYHSRLSPESFARAVQGMVPELAMLRGEALEVTQGADRWLHAFSVRELPKSPAERFKALFAERQRWTRPDIEPYLTGVEEAGATVEGLLLAWCRFSQLTPESVGYYTAR